MSPKRRVKPTIRKLNSVLSNTPEIELVIVFGSYGRGYPHEDSDLDLYIVTEAVEERIKTDSPSEIGLNWSQGLPEPDIVAIQPRRFVEKYYEGDNFLKTVLDEGLYVKGVPRDVRQKVDYDPISQSKEQ